MGSHEGRAHALLSASGASRWIACNKSARLEENFEDTTSVYAREGTFAHELIELKLKKYLGEVTDKDYTLLFSRLSTDEFFTEDLIGYVDQFVDYVIERYNVARKAFSTAKLFTERKVDLSEVIEEGFGTIDVSIIGDGTLEIIDYKHGQGVRVEAYKNSQLRIYGLGAYYEFELFYDIDRVRMTIFQPRLDNVVSDDMKIEDLLAWADEIVKPAAEKAYKGEGTLKAGAHCKFCKAAPRCKALAEYVQEVAKEEFGDPDLMKDSELVNVYMRLPIIQDFAKTVSSYMLNQAIKGKKWPEHKLVEGISRRRWKDEKAAFDELLASHSEELIVNKNLKGFGDLEKAIGKKTFNDLYGELIEKPPGAPTLVHESDGRPELNSGDSAREDFK